MRGREENGQGSMHGRKDRVEAEKKERENKGWKTEGREGKRKKRERKKGRKSASMRGMAEGKIRERE